MNKKYLDHRLRDKPNEDPLGSCQRLYLLTGKISSNNDINNHNNKINNDNKNNDSKNVNSNTSNNDNSKRVGNDNSGKS